MADEKVTVYNSPSKSEVVLERAASIQQNADIRGGKEKIFLNKSTYFNKLSEQSDDDFIAMVEMSPVYILYPKVVDGFTGTIFAKKPKLSELKLSETVVEQNKNIDLLGNSLDKYSEMVTSHVIENGFCASMNDYSDKLKRPFLRLIKPSEFVSYKISSESGYPRIKQFIFSEIIEIDDPDDEFGSISVNQYTVLDLSSNPDNNNKENYRVRIFEGIKKVESTKTTEEMVLKSTKFPMKNYEYFEEIPLTFHTASSDKFKIDKSLLQDISDMNISVMQRVVDQTYMLHWTALPTPYIIGVDGKDEGSPDSIGPSRIWYIDNPDAEVGMLEFTGSSARAHQDFIDNLLYIMAATGAQILKKEGVSRETATSVLVRTASQTSIVATMVNNVSDQLEDVYKIYFDWSGVTVTSEFSYSLNSDFIKVDMEPNAQIALVKSWLDGALSFPSMFNKMKEGELIDPNKTVDEELDDIKKYPPPFYMKNLDIESKEKSEESNGEDNNKEKDDTSGSNLENGNVDNKLATENV